MGRVPWRRPRLIVFVRPQAEELVLGGCKGGPGDTSFLTHHDNCHSDSQPCVTVCSSIGAS